MRDLPSTPKQEQARATDVYQRLHVPDSLSQARLKHPRARKGVRGSGASPHYLMEASLGGSRSDSSLSSFGADSLLEAGVKAGDFLRRRVKGCGHSTTQGEGKDLVWCGQGAPEQGGEKLKCPSCSPGACMGLWESLGAGKGAPQYTSQEVQSMKQGWGRCQRSLPRARESPPPSLEPPWLRMPVRTYATSLHNSGSIRGVRLHPPELTPVHSPPSAEVAP